MAEVTRDVGMSVVLCSVAVNVKVRQIHDAVVKIAIKSANQIKSRKLQNLEYSMFC